MIQLFQRYVPYSSVLDFVVQSLLCLTAFTLAVQVAWHTQFDPTLPSLTGVRIGRAVTSVSVLVIVFYLTGYFERRSHLSSSLFVPRLLQAVPLSALTLALLYQFVPTVALGWEVAGGALGLMTVFMLGWHALAPAVVNDGVLAENILLIGDGELARQLAEQIHKFEHWGLRLTGYIPVGGPDHGKSQRSAARVGASRSVAGSRACAAPGTPAHARVLPFPVPTRMDAPALGRVQDLEAIVFEKDIQTVVVALGDRRGKLPLASLINAKLRGVTVFDAIDFYERLTGRLLVSRMRPSTIIFSEGFAPSRMTLFGKRVLDIVAAATLALLTAPIQVAVAVAVACTSKGPILFRQERIGYAGLPFTMLKYRTMRVDAEKNGPQWASEQDDRITPIGRFLRRSRLDELPQVWNILAGHMSFVGPRPEQPTFVRNLRSEIPYYDQRHGVRPGLTGWAQVKFPYGASVEDAEEKLEFDLYYIKRLSVAFDITIIFETVRVMLAAQGSR